MIAQLLEFSIALAIFATLALMASPSAVRRGPRGDSVLSAVVLGLAAALVAATSRDPVGALLLFGAGAGLCLVIRAAAPDWQLLGCTLFAGVVASSFGYLAYVTLLTFSSSLSAVGLAVSLLLLFLELSALALTTTYVHEVVDVLARRRWLVVDKPAALSRRPPRVCLQVPTYNEPVELVKATLDALARLDYPSYMVQLVDNNTTDPELWQPIEEHCRRLGRKFHFMHLEDWPGYKAGALNEATRRLPESIEVVAVVDADYVVEPGFLRETVGFFADPQVAFVQTPQHYREWADDTYLTHCFYAYKYFFDVTMPSRAQRNAIIFGGTMGLIRRSVLDAIGGWDEWCITEDAEASLRILADGHRGVYVNKAFGHGIMPLSLDGLKKQRFRWAFGGVQILRKHWLLMLTGRQRDGSRSRLTLGQRYHYLAGSLQWFNELLTVGFTGLLLLSALVVVLGHHLPMRQLTGALLAVPLLFIATGLLRLTWALRVRSGARATQALGALGVLFSLSWVVARACVQGLFRERGVFVRTPKARSRSSLVRSVTSTRAESAFAVAAVGLGLTMLALHPGKLSLALAALTLVQGAIYVNAPLNALRAEGIRLTPLRRAFRGSPQNTGQRPAITARRARNALIAGALAAAASTFVAAVATAPEGAGMLSPGSLLPQLGGAIGTVASAGTPSPMPGTSPRATASSSSAGAGQATPPPSTLTRTTSTPGSAATAPAGAATPAVVKPGSAPSAAPTAAPTSHPTAAASPPVARPTPTPHRP